MQSAAAQQSVPLTCGILRHFHLCLPAPAYPPRVPACATVAAGTSAVQCRQDRQVHRPARAVGAGQV